MLKYVWQFILLCLLQVLIFNNLNLGGYVNPFPYIYENLSKISEKDLKHFKQHFFINLKKY